MADPAPTMNRVDRPDRKRAVLGAAGMGTVLKYGSHGLSAPRHKVNHALAQPHAGAGGTPLGINHGQGYKPAP